MRLPRWIGPGAVVFLAVWVLLLVGGRAKFFNDPGTFWHITTGELILAHGFIRSDPYTFTFGGTWWVPYQWLGEVVMALVHRAGGFDALLLGAVSVVAGLFAWLAVRLMHAGLRPLPAAGVMLLGLAAAASHFHVRPHLFTEVAMAVTAAVLVGIDAGRLRPRAAWWLPPLFAVWANVHGGVLAGIGTVGLAVLGWVAFWRVGLRSPVAGWRDAGGLAAAAAACGAATLVNPYGLDLLRTWSVIMGEPVLKEIIVEHRPLDPLSLVAGPVFALAAFYLFVLAGLEPTPGSGPAARRGGLLARLRDVRVSWLLPLVWLVLAFDRVRHAPLFAVVTLVAVASVWPHTRWARWLAVHRPEYQRRPDDPPDTPAWANLWLPAAAVLTAFVLQVGGVKVPVVGAGWAHHDPTYWPVELLDVLKEHEPRSPGDPYRLFNDYIDGGFVIYHAPGYKVFVDDRCEVFGGQWLLEFVQASGGDTAAAVARWEREYGRFDFAMTRTGTGFDDYFRNSPDWQLVKRAEIGAFYKRRDQDRPPSSPGRPD